MRRREQARVAQAERGGGGRTGRGRRLAKGAVVRRAAGDVTRCEAPRIASPHISASCEVGCA